VRRANTTALFGLETGTDVGYSLVSDIHRSSSWGARASTPMARREQKEKNMSDLVHVNDGNFDNEVLKSDIPVLVDFSAAWCGPCQRLKPIIEELATEYAGRVKVAHVDIDEAQTTASKYAVMSVPTLKFIKGGEIVDQAIGLLSKTDLASRMDKMVD